MNEEQWIRTGRSFGKKGTVLWATDCVGRQCGSETTACFDDMMADANEWRAHKAFVKAAEKGVAMYRAARALDEEAGTGYFSMIEGTDVDNDLLHAAALLPKPPEPAPTLAEQGEEIKAEIDGLCHLCERTGQVCKIKATVDTIVAAGKAK